jgi:SAM-dependent methyltransferase
MNIKAIANQKLLSLLISHPPKFIHCEICGGRRLCVRTDPHPLPGTRCIACRGTAKHRGIYAVLQRIYGPTLGGLRGCAAYELSAHGALFKTLRKRSTETGFALTCSEYVDDLPPGAIVNGARCENVEALTFPDHSFDLVTSTDVFEHVENDIVGFREIARVLRPGGNFVFTVPYQDGHTLIRGVRETDGTIRHLMPPEYHGDPFRGMSVYTWRTYGEDIVDRIAAAGLSARVEQVHVAGLQRITSPVVIASKLP